MGLGAEFQELADELLTEFDERTEKAVLITPGEKVYSPTEGRYVYGDATERELTGVATAYDNSLIASGTVNAGDVKFICTRAVEPTTNDSVRLDGKVYGVESVMPKAYTGMDLVISYEIQLRV